MGNDVCCDDDDKGMHQITIINKRQPKCVPQLTKAMIKSLLIHKPFEKQLPANPIVKEFGSSVYEGAVDEKGRPMGFGKIFHKDGSLFIGAFSYGYANGDGFYLKTDGSFYRGKMVDNQAHDDHGYIWSPQYEYSGSVRHNAPHGKGQEVCDRYLFVGEYQHGKMVQGLLKWEESGQLCWYEGSFNQEGLFEGYGTLHHGKKGTYEGDFVRGMKHGKGTYLFTNKLKYVGEYRHNHREGKGTLYNMNNTIAYEGEWSDNLPHGEGITTTTHGETLHRLWIQGLDASQIE